MKSDPECPSNIGENETKKRLVFGWAMLVISVMASFALYRAEGRLSRLVLFLPLFFSCLGFIQSKRKVCALHGLYGTQNMDSGDRKLTDSSIVAVLRKASSKILLLSAGIAASITLIFFLIP